MVSIPVLDKIVLIDRAFVQGPPTKPQQLSTCLQCSRIIYGRGGYKCSKWEVCNEQKLFWKTPFLKKPRSRLRGLNVHLNVLMKSYTFQVRFWSLWWSLWKWLLAPDRMSGAGNGIQKWKESEQQVSTKSIKHLFLYYTSEVSAQNHEIKTG